MRDDEHVDRGVMPDYPVTYSIEYLATGKDKEMELALSLARGETVVTYLGRSNRY